MENNKDDRWKQLPAFVHRAIFEMPLTLNQLVVYFYIVAHRDSKTRQAFPGVRKIAARFKMNKNTVSSAVKRLEKLNMIKKTREMRGSAVVYEITNYSDWRFAGALVSDEKERQKSVPPLIESVPASVPGLTNSSNIEGSIKEVIKGSGCPTRATKEQLEVFADSRGLKAQDGVFIFQHLESIGWQSGGSKIKDAFAFFQKYEVAGWLPSQQKQKSKSTPTLFAIG